jgi:hypothetical protein
MAAEEERADAARADDMFAPPAGGRGRKGGIGRG